METQARGREQRKNLVVLFEKIVRKPATANDLVALSSVPPFGPAPALFFGPLWRASCQRSGGGAKVSRAEAFAGKKLKKICVVHHLERQESQIAVKHGLHTQQ